MEDWTLYHKYVEELAPEPRKRVAKAFTAQMAWSLRRMADRAEQWDWDWDSNARDLRAHLFYAFRDVLALASFELPVEGEPLPDWLLRDIAEREAEQEGDSSGN